MVFRVGQKVVCVDDAWPGPKIPGWERPVAGQVYTVREILTFIPREGGHIRLVEIRNPISRWQQRDDIVEVAFRADRFRPVAETKTDISIFQKMLTPKKEKSNVC